MSDLDVSQLISVKDAERIIDAAVVRPRVERVPLRDAVGRVLAETLSADRDYPPFDRAQMDGYAVRSTEAAAGVALRVRGEIAAGRPVELSIGAGEAAAIMTGAPMPDGADAVIPIERCEPSADGGTVRLLVPAKPGLNVTPRGGDVPRGATLLEPGAMLGPAQVAVAATVGAATIVCHARPRCALLATGDELAPLGVAPQTWQIRNSNNDMLRTLLVRLGGEVVDNALAPDDPVGVRAAIDSAAQRGDVLFVSGGMSMGKYDFVPQALRAAGFELRITKLRIRPGKPFVFAFRPRDGKFAFGLPGNPVSAFVCTLRLASRLIRRMIGRGLEPVWIHAPLARPLATANGPREFYQPAWWDGARVTPLEWNGSADVFTLARANVLLVRPENDPAHPSDAMARLLEIPS
jgi:molybdopterin molybdotransferase